MKFVDHSRETTSRHNSSERSIITINPPVNTSPWLTTKEACRHLKISRETLRKREKNGDIRACGSSGKKVWHINDLNALVRRKPTQATTPVSQLHVKPWGSSFSYFPTFTL